MAGDRGQAQIEAIAAIALLTLVAILGIKAGAAINAALVADAATHAGALAQSAGGDGAEAARRALPRSARSESRIHAGDGAISVKLGPITSTAWSRLPGG